MSDTTRVLAEAAGTALCDCVVIGVKPDLDRIPGRPYCSGHTARAYVGLPPKKPRTSSQNRETQKVMA